MTGTYDGEMINKNNIYIYIILLVTPVIVLVIEHFTHIEFLLHVAAIPIEVLVAVFIVEMYLESRQKKERRRQLMHIKSCMFRLEMRNLFVTNFLALKTPPLTIGGIKGASLHELKKMREQANNVQYQSLEAMEPVIMEYVAAQSVWRNFMNIALDYGFDDIFQDMVYILHFITDVKTYKENNPGKLFIHKAAENKLLMQKVLKVLGDGIRKYLDYAIELREKQPELFEEIIADYELATQIRS
jgi:hypothetical protein